MARRKTRTLTEVELEFMQIVWDREEVSSDDVLDELASRGRKLTDGSVRKVFSILLEKGYVTRRREGRKFLHKAKVQPQQAHGSMIRDLVKRAFHGSSALMMAALLEEQSVNADDLKKIKKLIADYEESDSP